MVTPYMAEQLRLKSTKHGRAWDPELAKFARLNLGVTEAVAVGIKVPSCVLQELASRAFTDYFDSGEYMKMAVMFSDAKLPGASADVPSQLIISSIIPDSTDRVRIKIDLILAKIHHVFRSDKSPERLCGLTQSFKQMTWSATSAKSDQLVDEIGHLDSMLASVNDEASYEKAKAARDYFKESEEERMISKVCWVLELGRAVLATVAGALDCWVADVAQTEKLPSLVSSSTDLVVAVNATIEKNDMQPLVKFVTIAKDMGMVIDQYELARASCSGGFWVKNKDGLQQVEQHIGEARRRLFSFIAEYFWTFLIRCFQAFTENGFETLTTKRVSEQDTMAKDLGFQFTLVGSQDVDLTKIFTDKAQSEKYGEIMQARSAFVATMFAGVRSLACKKGAKSKDDKKITLDLLDEKLLAFHGVLHDLKSLTERPAQDKLKDAEPSLQEKKAEDALEDAELSPDEEPPVKKQKVVSEEVSTAAEEMGTLEQQADSETAAIEPPAKKQKVVSEKVATTENVLFHELNVVSLSSASRDGLQEAVSSCENFFTSEVHSALVPTIRKGGVGPLLCLLKNTKRTIEAWTAPDMEASLEQFQLAVAGGEISAADEEHVSNLCVKYEKVLADCNLTVTLLDDTDVHIPFALVQHTLSFGFLMLAHQKFIKSHNALKPDTSNFIEQECFPGFRVSARCWSELSSAVLACKKRFRPSTPEDFQSMIEDFDKATKDWEGKCAEKLYQAAKLSVSTSLAPFLQQDDVLKDGEAPAMKIWDGRDELSADVQELLQTATHSKHNKKMFKRYKAWLKFENNCKCIAQHLPSFEMKRIEDDAQDVLKVVRPLVANNIAFTGLFRKFNDGENPKNFAKAAVKESQSMKCKLTHEGLKNLLEKRSGEKVDFDFPAPPDEHDLEGAAATAGVQGN